MQSFIEPYLPQIRALCKQMGVKEMYLVGSAARGADFTAESDVDILCEYIVDDAGMPKVLDYDYFDLLWGLEEILGRKVDLMTVGGIKNPYVKASMEKDKQFLYAA